MPDQESKITEWFMKLIESVIRSHAKNANLEFFQRKYPRLNVEIIAIRRINTAAKFAGLVGFASGIVFTLAGATAISSAVGTIATGLLGSPVSVPALAVSLPIWGGAFIGEVALLIRIQLHLAYDLFVLNGLPVDIEDPEQMQEVVQVAFGIKAAELAGQALQKSIPQFAPQMLRNAMREGLVRRKIQDSVAKKISRSFARNYLAEGALIKALIPVLSIVTAAWWNFTTTNGIGKTLHFRIRQRGLAVKELEKLNLNKFDSPDLVLQAVIFIGFSGNDFSEIEPTFYSNLVGMFRDIYGSEKIDLVNPSPALDWDDVVIDLANVTDPQQRVDIYNLLVAMVVVGGKLNRQKSKRLENIAKLYDLKFDKRAIETRCKRFEETKPFRTCLFIILILVILMSLICLLVSLKVFGN